MLRWSTQIRPWSIWCLAELYIALAFLGSESPRRVLADRGPSKMETGRRSRKSSKLSGARNGAQGSPETGTETAPKSRKSSKLFGDREMISS